MIRKGFLSFVLLVFYFAAVAQNVADKQAKEWVDRIFKSMTEEERLGQLFMVAAYSNKGEGHEAAIEKLVMENHVGGLIFFQGGPGRQAVLTNRYQAAAKVPLLIAIDGEWGLEMRLDSTMYFPKQMTLGAITQDSLIYQMGREIARQCRRIGIHVNFAPVVDINSNPKNPIIGIRSFGEDKENVARKGVAYMQGMQDEQVIACAKHFPGHGDTDSDSHVSLPVIRHSKERLDTMELYPFKKLIAAGIKSMMVAHIHVPTYDSRKNRATTLSHKVVAELLKKDMGFEGLVFTDALNMKGVSQFYKPGLVDVEALLAGNDVLLFAEDVEEGVAQIKRAIDKGQISQKEVDRRVKKILMAKYWVGLDNYKPIDLEGLEEDLHRPEAIALRKRLYQEAVTVVNNKNRALPLHILDTLTLASVVIGEESGNNFQRTLDKYASFKHYQVSGSGTASEFSSLKSNLSDASMVIVSIHQTGKWYSRFPISNAAVQFVDELSKDKSVIVVLFGNAYSAATMQHVPWLIEAYENNEVVQQVVPQIIFGALPAKGRLPVSPSNTLRAGEGFQTGYLGRLKYSIPEEIGISSYDLKRIDTIAQEAIDIGATPGCQVLVAKEGHVIFQKTYGHYTYDKQKPVDEKTMYDLASVTKVAAATQALMFLAERQVIDLDEKISTYLPELKGSNKEDMILRDIMIHQAGLYPYVEFWKNTIDSTGLMSCYYSEKDDTVYCEMVAPGLYGAANLIEDSLLVWVAKSKLLDKNRRTKKYDYKYSDLGYYLLKKVLERELNQPLDVFISQNFYKPLGRKSLTYRPLEQFEQEMITPTELDTIFRSTLVQGTVHDQGAAMMGGVAAHAGLFGTANDLAVLMQMNLQGGYYGGAWYLDEETIDIFTSKQREDNRRGIGWDKPEPDGYGPTSDYASPSTFGHSGFTGTGVWVDPEYDLIYVFLSNRVYPNAGNNLLIKKDIRTRIHDVIYKALPEYKDYK